MSLIKKFIDMYNLNEILIKDIQEKILIKHYRKGEYILEAHKGANSIYFIVQGTVEVSCILDNGNQVCLNVLKPLEIFGDIEYINKEEVLFDVIAKSDVIVILLPFQIANEYLINNINFWKFLALEGNKKLLNTNRAIFYKSTLKAKDIFSKYIEDNGGEITFRSLDELSSRLNISYRNLTRIIAQYVKNNTIEKNRNSIKLLKGGKK
ncbi:Crp/Fnr family transcriptional regulator [Cetobacterium sp.]|uniref:Crp/Fnr family transcriptional regulator n=2 Tax=Cetobacterium sp. TaxID=2071632 RepID=UPI002FC64062